MSKINDTIYLLILDPSENDAEKLISLLRNAGIPTRAKRIESEEEFVDALEEQSWDLFVAREKEADFDINQALVHIRQKDRDLPFIVLSDAYDDEQLVKHMKAGAKDVVPFENDKHIVVVLRRELESRADRKKLRLMEAKIRDAEHRCELLLDSSKDAIAYISDGMHIYANSSYMQFLGYDDIDEMICIPVLDTFNSESQSSFKELSKPFSDNPQAEKTEATTCISIREDGTEISATMSLSAATYDGEDCLQIIIRPEHDNEELAEKIKELSQQDLLTGLYNRQYFMEQLHDAKECAVNNSTHAGVLYLAIDNFQKIKTNFGMADADLVLRDLAHVIDSNRKSDHHLARLSDDVFGLICPAQNGDDAVEVAQAYGQAVEDHLFEVDGKTIQITLSTGVTLITENAPAINDILGRAQTASQELASQDNAEEINGVKLYTIQTDKPLDDHDMAMELIQDAIDNDKFKLLFQPIISLRGEGDENYEAFIRMLNEEGEEISPYDFLPPSGPSNMASKIDKWVILQTIKHLSEHRSKGHDTKLFINLTSETLQDQTFTSWLNVALKAARLPGDSLIFQISENNAITYMKQAKEFAKGISTLHCKMSINQFGHALKPFNLLKHLSPEYIKLEGSFTQDMQKGEDSKEQAKEMIQTLQSMGKLTIVPLVESAALLSTLWQAGVNYIQGYYLQAPSTEMNYDFSEEN
ncbi:MULTISPECIES: EAL domain-containing protein [unclassified Oleiphilus]|jgi:diguanylate cyclase (GGDEF)-like protein|uniref:EAL domain-containing response regulator n=8 Tax=Oleiphilus TaxID=141450 RepID=UPI0007C3DF7A|nr:MULTISPECIES: EAL domain-containing protein [unclassified Oleiphilus]KZY83350.1 diguanylate cyclase [Oleiphilus sp. HI0069]KZZ11629.1 diguanylate cyclase [Oleiphilus sp. HI0078]KZZ34363.1 diguanylate cyclase [Oleiphilus sp. HI0085]KZY39176.1 diguanylate cyclase [Oleiphilus sp. HI0043]KZY61516.1 diguanylate cyclase [Oleiphilus sp. HI0061]